MNIEKIDYANAGKIYLHKCASCGKDLVKFQFSPDLKIYFLNSYNGFYFWISLDSNISSFDAGYKLHFNCSFCSKKIMTQEDKDFMRALLLLIDTKNLQKYLENS